MIKIFFYISCQLVALSFIQCNSSTKNDTIQKIAVKQDSLASASDSLISMITCPSCGFQKEEIMPTEVCQLKYTCSKCDTTLLPKQEDCCVYCSYGTKKCPSMQ